MLYPDETAIWEERLYQMSLGKDNLEAFLRDQLDFLKSLVTAAGGVVMKVEGAKACPDCGSPMVKRHGKYGDFYGCSNYPKCRHTEPITEAEKDGEAKPSPYPCPRCKKGPSRKDRSLRRLLGLQRSDVQHQVCRRRRRAQPVCQVLKTAICQKDGYTKSCPMVL